MINKQKLKISINNSELLWMLYCEDFQPLHAVFNKLDPCKFEDYFLKYNKIDIIMFENGFEMYGFIKDNKYLIMDK